MTNRNRENGAVIVELSIVVPLMALILFLVFDLGGALISYLQLAHVASEGARLASKVVELESVEDGGEAWFENLHLEDGGSCATEGPCPEWTTIHHKIASLVDLSRIDIDQAQLQISTRKGSATWSTGGGSGGGATTDPTPELETTLSRDFELKLDDTSEGEAEIGEAGGAAGPTFAYDTVDIEIRAIYRGSFPVFEQIPIRFSVRAPYLARSYSSSF